MKVRNLGANIVQLNTMGVRNQSILYSMQEIAWALCVGYTVYVSEALINYCTHKTSPTKKILCGILNTRES